MIPLPILHGACRFSPTMAVLLSALLSSTSSIFAKEMTPARIKAATSAVDIAAIKANTATSQDWPTIGLDYAETHFSKLNQITSDNVKGLGLECSYSLNSERGIEATPHRGRRHHVPERPVEHRSIVHAIDVRTGKKIGSFDPGVNGGEAPRRCCDVVNRGVAVYKGKVFVAAYHSRLIALNTATRERCGKGHAD